jgi:diapolycopene oxygenase
MTTKHIIIVGGGLAGLAAACELSTLSKNSGGSLRITLVEKNAHVGGKMNVLRERGFSFDMGPTIITMPQVLTGILTRAGKRPQDYIDLIDLDPQWRCFYEDGVVVNLFRDVEKMARTVDQQFPHEKPGAGYKAFLEFSRRMMRLSRAVFFYKDLGAATDLMFGQTGKQSRDPAIMKDVLGMRMHSTVGATVHKHINEPHLRQLCEHFLQYVGSSPFLAPAILSLIASAQADHGCWYPMGGTRQVARTLERLAGEQGVNFELGVGVKKVLTRDGRAAGVELADGRVIEADAVVSNCDSQRTYRDLIGEPPAMKRLHSIAKTYTPACSGVVLYLGLDRQYDHLAHHNFLFSKDSHSEFNDIYKLGIPARDPTLYIAAPSRTDAGQAPPGGEALYILVHTAYVRSGQDWHGPGGMLEQYKPVIMDKLRRFGMADIDRHIIVDRFLTPTGIESLYNAEGGAIYGLASHGRFAGGFKPKNRCPVYKRLYLTGGSANPGPGVPMVIMSGVTAGRCAAEDLGVTLPEIELGPPVGWDAGEDDPTTPVAVARGAKPQLAGAR